MTIVTDDVYNITAGTALQVGPTNPAPLQLSVSPSSINEAQANCPITSSVATANVSGGEGPYSYAWTRISGSLSISINSPSNQSTTFTKSLSGFLTSTMQCQVTDTNNDTATDTVSVTLDCGGF